MHDVCVDDIEVIFYEENQESTSPLWSAKGLFGPYDVHHQYAIVVQTPPIDNLQLQRPKQIMIALRRPSDGQISKPRPFFYMPMEFGTFVCVSARGLRERRGLSWE